MAIDLVLMADELEHLVNPRALVRQVRTVLNAEGTAVFCVPNIAHWYPGSVQPSGCSDTTDAASSMRPTCASSPGAASAGCSSARGRAVRRVEPVGLPLDALGVEEAEGYWLRMANLALLNAWPTMFGYQFILEATPTSD